MALERIMTLVVLLALLLCSLSSTASSLPFRAVDDQGKPHEEDPQGDHKVSSPKPPLRHIRETSETVATASTTTSSVPPESTTEPPTELQPVCNEETRVQRGCLNLREFLLQIYGNFNNFAPDTTVNAFMLDDLIFFNLLDSNSTEEQEVEETSYWAGQGRQICDTVIRRKYRNLTQSAENGKCSWRYTCDFDFNRFPRVRVQAELIGSSHRCEAVRMPNVDYFERTSCNNDPCGRSTWQLRRKDIIIGYEHDSS